MLDDPAAYALCRECSHIDRHPLADAWRIARGVLIDRAIALGPMFSSEFPPLAAIFALRRMKNSGVL
jgi:hypothetical protein